MASPDRREGRRAALALAALVALVAVAFAAPIRRGGFLSDAFHANLILRDGRLDLGRVLAEFWSPWLGIAGHQAYRPVVTLHYALDWTFFGANPLGYHASNAALHALSAAWVLLIVRRLLPSRGWTAAFLAAAVFAVHPARAEAVAWIPGRVSSTAGFFALGSVAFGLAHARAGRGAHRWACLAFLAAALLAKEEAASVPFALFFAEGIAEPGGGIPSRGWTRPALRRALPPFLLLGAYLATRRVVLGSFAGEGAGGGAGGAVSRFAEGLPGKARALLYPLRPELATQDGWRLAAAAAFLGVPLLLLAATLRRGGRGSWRRVACALGWTLAALAPAYPIAVRDHFGGARTLYLASVPLAVLLALALPPPSRRRGALRPAALAALEAFAVAVPLALLHGEHRRWEEGWRIARRFLAEADRVHREDPRGAPIALVAFPYEAPGAGVPVFNTDSVHLALQRPYLPEDLPVVNLIQAVLAGKDAAPLRAASAVTPKVVGWSPSTESLVPYPASPPADFALGWPSGATRLEVGASGPAELRFEPGAIDPRSVEAVEVVLRGAPDSTIAVLAWSSRERVGDRAWDDPLSRIPLRLAEARNGETAFRATIGNHLGWYLRSLEGGVRALALRLEARERATVEIESLRFRGTIEFLGVPVLDGEELPGPSGWTLPLGSAGEGSYRVVLLAPNETRSLPFEVGPSARGAIGLDAETVRVLEAAARLSNTPVGYYFFERLDRHGDPWSATARSALGRFRLRRAPHQRRRTTAAW